MSHRFARVAALAAVLSCLPLSRALAQTATPGGPALVAPVPLSPSSAVATGGFVQQTGGVAAGSPTLTVIGPPANYTPQGNPMLVPIGGAPPVISGTAIQVGSFTAAGGPAAAPVGGSSSNLQTGSFTAAGGPSLVPVGGSSSFIQTGSFTDAGGPGLVPVGGTPPSATATAIQTAPPGGSPNVPDPNTIHREPALLFDVTGMTLLGEVRRQLVVYNDGLMHLTETLGASGFQRFELKSIPPERVHDLQVRLWQLGAYSLQDQSIIVADLPLKTLTVFNGATDATAHTFSYWIADLGHAAVDELLEDLIATHFAQ